MQKFIKKQIGRETHNFVVEGKTLFDVMQEASKLSFGDVKKCGCCGSDALVLNSHIAQKKYKYVTVKCLSCKASVNFGQQQEDPEIFYLRTKQEGDKKVLDWRPYGEGDQ